MGSFHSSEIVFFFYKLENIKAYFHPEYHNLKKILDNLAKAVYIRLSEVVGSILRLLKAFSDFKTACQTE